MGQVCEKVEGRGRGRRGEEVREGGRTMWVVTLHHHHDFSGWLIQGRGTGSKSEPWQCCAIGHVTQVQSFHYTATGVIRPAIPMSRASHGQGNVRRDGTAGSTSYT